MHNAWLLAIILGYFALLLGIAFYTSRNATNESFFIGNRSSNWVLVAFGMIGTSLSGMTFISVPGTVGPNPLTGIAGGLGYFQVVIGYFLGYFIVAYVLLPLYYRLGLTSIYSYLEGRFGTTAYKTGALFFILSRTLGATLRLYLVIKVLEKFVLEDLGISFELTSVLILLLILLYTYRGGVKTIVWTDTLQTTFMLLALGACVWYLLKVQNLTIPSAGEALSTAGFTKLFNTDPLSGGFFLKNIIGGAAITVAMTGLDQEMMQKNISVRTLGDSQKNVVVLSVLQAVVVFIFLLLGGLLSLNAQKMGFEVTSGDNLFPHFAMQAAPFAITVCFLIGLISALFPSADGALTALTSSFCIDILGIQKKAKGYDARRQKSIRMRVHYTFALVFLACVFLFREIDNGQLIDLLLRVAGYTYGPLLALFVFGMATKRNLQPALVPFVCLAAPVLTFLLKTFEAQYLGGYVIGVELLLINAALTYLGLLIISRPAGENLPAAADLSPAEA